MKKLIIIILLILLSIVLNACSGQVVYGVKSMEREIDLYKGKEVVTKEDSIAISSLQFDGQSENSFVFYTYIKNKSNHKVLVKPKEIFAEVTDENLISLEKCCRIFTLNPEYQIATINKEMKSLEEWHQMATGLNILGGVVSVVADLASDDARNIAVFADNQITENENYEYSKEWLQQQKEFWRNEVLRNSHLYKDEDIGGLVFLPINKKAKYIRIIIPIGDTEHCYYFKQVKMR